MLSRSSPAIWTAASPSAKLWCSLRTSPTRPLASPCYQPQLPQRPGPVQQPQAQLIAQPQQLPLTTWRRHLDGADVVGQVKARVIDPQRQPLPNPGPQHPLTQAGHQLQAAAELLADSVHPQAAIGAVQRPTLSDGQDGDMLGQPGVLQIQEPGVLNTQALVAAGELAHRHLPGPIHAVGRPPRSARSLIPRSIRWVITKATTATGSTSNGAHRWV